MAGVLIFYHNHTNSASKSDRTSPTELPVRSNFIPKRQVRQPLKISLTSPNYGD
ncbi:MAG: hypothetical protein U7126_01920 [Microcoleus sp.]